MQNLRKGKGIEFLILKTEQWLLTFRGQEHHLALLF